MYKAIIESAEISNGRLVVTVLFNSDNDSFKDSFDTNQYQNMSWIREQIGRKLNQLNSLYAIKDSISIGPFNDTINVKTDKDIFYEKASHYTRFMDTARMGIIKHDRPIIAELRKWLEENFKDEYID